jgi:hypothetical protein
VAKGAPEIVYSLISYGFAFIGLTCGYALVALSFAGFSSLWITLAPPFAICVLISLATHHRQPHRRLFSIIVLVLAAIATILIFVGWKVALKK